MQSFTFPRCLKSDEAESKKLPQLGLSHGKVSFSKDVEGQEVNAGLWLLLDSRVPEKNISVEWKFVL